MRFAILVSFSWTGLKTIKSAHPVHLAWLSLVLLFVVQRPSGKSRWWRRRWWHWWSEKEVECKFCYEAARYPGNAQTSGYLTMFAEWGRFCRKCAIFGQPFSVLVKTGRLLTWKNFMLSLSMFSFFLRSIREAEVWITVFWVDWRMFWVVEKLLVNLCPCLKNACLWM